MKRVIKKWVSLVSSLLGLGVFIFIIVASGFARPVLAAPLLFSVNTQVFVNSTTTFTVASGSVANAFTVNATGVIATLSASTGGTFTLSATSTDLSVNASGGGGSAPVTCTNGTSSVTITQSSGSASYTITPTGSVCVPVPSSSIVVTVGNGGELFTLSSSTTSTTKTASSTQISSSVTVPTASSSPTISPQGQFGPFHFDSNLQLWDSGSEVTSLQKFLISHNAGPSAQALAHHGTTKIFGLLTYGALVEFQLRAGIQPASGFFGPKTRAYINALSR